MALPILEQDSGSGLAIGTEQAMGSFTAARDVLVYVDIRLTLVVNTAANFTVRVLKRSAVPADIKNEGPFTEPKFAAGDTIYGPPLIGPIAMRSGEILVPYIKSSVADTVNWEVDYYDAFAKDAVMISGGATEADRLEAALGTGNYIAADVVKWLGTVPLGLSSQRVQVDVQAIEGFSAAAMVLGWWLAEGVAPIADSGTTTTLVDAVLTQADGYWNGALLIFRSGTNVGRTAIITDFDAATDTLTFAPAVPDAVTTEGYVLIPGLGHADITDALNTPITGSPPVNSINERLKTLDDNYTAGRGGYLDELHATNLPSDIDDILEDIETSGVVLASSEDVYWADIHFTRDSANGKDEYEVVWIKNDAPITSDITEPTIQVVKRADGTDLVEEVAMDDEIGTTGAYKYDEDTNRLTLGEAALVIVTATIDTATRTWSRVVGRDSSA